MPARDHHEVIPTLPRQELHQRIGAHGGGRQCVKDVCTAGPIAERHVARAAVEDDGPFGFRKIGDGQEFIGRRIDDQVGGGSKRLSRRGKRVVAEVGHVFRQRPVLAEELARGLVVLERGQRTGKAQIFGFRVEIRERRRQFSLYLEPGDGNILCSRSACPEAQKNCQ